MKKTAAGTLLSGSLLVAGGLGLAHAAPPQAQSVVGDAKVNVTLSVNNQQLGVIQDVSLTNAEALATAVCPGENLSGRLSDLDTNMVQDALVCNGLAGGLSYTFAQNGPGNSETAPGQNRPAAPTMTPSTTSVTPAPSAAEGR